MKGVEMSLADRIRERLEVVKKSASGASLEAGLSRSAIQDILSGNSTSPRLDTLEKLTGPLQCSIEYLVGGATEKGRGYFADLMMDRVSLVLSSGTFRRKFEFGGRQDIDTSEREYPIARDERLPAWNMQLFRLADEALELRGLQRGDILHVATPPFEDDTLHIALKRGQIVTISHTLHPVGLTEHAARIVEPVAGGFELVPASTKEFDAYRIGGASMGSVNSYSTDDGWITITGLVTGLYREVPIDQ
nr:helix-turn-helix transcriptional regulator [Methylobacterium sp. ZNC0032]